MAKEHKLAIDDETVIMLETLIQSPAFTALKKVIAQYRATTHATLYTSNESHDLYRSQGVLIGLGVVENLPSLLVSQRQENLKKAEQLKKFVPKKPEPFHPNKI